MRHQVCQLHCVLKQSKLVWIGLSWNVYLQTRYGYFVYCIWLLVQSLNYILTWACGIFKEGDGRPKINYVTVFERPGLKEFLRQLSEFADLVLFTAGLEGLPKNTKLHSCILFFWELFLMFLNDIWFYVLTGYARPLVDKIDLENRFILRLYRPSTIST